MIEVFIAFTKGTNIAPLERTLEAWDLPGLEPIAIQAGLRKFEIHRRVTAENVSRGTYILASLERGPVEENVAELAEKLLAENPKVGLIYPSSLGDETGAVAVCRKGIITHWEQEEGSYEAAHARAYERAGFQTITLCPTLHYRRLAGSLPSSYAMARPH